MPRNVWMDLPDQNIDSLFNLFLNKKPVKVTTEIFEDETGVHLYTLLIFKDETWIGVSEESKIHFGINPKEIKTIKDPEVVDIEKIERNNLHNVYYYKPCKQNFYLANGLYSTSRRKNENNY